MTATVETVTGVGRVARVTGPVVDVEFPVEAMPALFNALNVDVTFDQGDEGGGSHTLTLEVAQHIGDNMVRTISMQPTDGLVRGAPVRDTGDAIHGPRRRCHQGPRVEHTGVPLDVKASDLDIKERWSIHRQAPALTNLSQRLRSSTPVSRSSTCSPLTSRVERSACSVEQVW